MTEKETVITAVNFFGIRILDLFRISNFGFRISRRVLAPGSVLARSRETVEIAGEQVFLPIP
jgi:hypothetical protein